jgi:hypothetical protein
LLAAALAAAAPPETAAPFVELVRCGEAPGGWCAQPEPPAGQAVLVLGKDCRGVSAPRGRVEWTACAHPDAGDVAAVGRRVEGYRPLKVALVKDAAALERLEGLVRLQKGFPARLARVEARLRRAYAASSRPYDGVEFSAWSLGGRGYLAVFDGEPLGDALPYLVAGSKASPLTEGPERCATAKDAFLAAGKAWLRLSDCACGTDSCRASFRAIE